MSHPVDEQTNKPSLVSVVIIPICFKNQLKEI